MGISQLFTGNSTAVDLVVSLQCSQNMLEGDTGYLILFCHLKNNGKKKKNITTINL